MSKKFTSFKPNSNLELQNFLELSDREREMVLQLISETIWVFDDELRGYDFIVEAYYNARIQDRDPSIKWPEKLSKKERVICKMNMLKKILKCCQASEPESDWIYNVCRGIVFSITNNIFKSNTESKWPGLSDIEASVLNCIYTSLIKSYENQIVF
jgi:hypothetical protein